MAPLTSARGYSIGALSRATGVKVETIRYYERIGIMPEPGRTAGGNRQYTHEHLKRLSFIRRCRALGFPVAEIRALLSMVDSRDVTCGEVHAIVTHQLAEVRRRLADLARLEADLSAMAAQCAQGDVPACPIIDTLFDDDAPSLPA
ncbi:MerR family transcriptional regulator, mercuric resistance operon regulatory protein [Meinhardsimonia xiamenensis]|jgi:MerR family mercuric resistance operon transcriptional regulator|uniref:MerR family transcriptional regulator, mercuric resistance operon regulatory protein n=1 Tax=Meinhardsimonia xiamenensis TaxID=990712 RepID=A0A1G8XUC8_9RHOB|nr:helix-turn-helix domain-containing protein [Meinhardsimonia xiamenensis]PRX37035.1 MerR family mercuric resistance operon transcriptional regulator [Meinhardsimonia xiamenensis]SDJ93764.1 MerR family transcriptional regulator, mercuric resistance operon regulatory protein [Meinhardsimonia xiamenensis]